MVGLRYIAPYETALDAAGVSLPGARLYFYISETATPLNTYSDEDLTIPNTNPVVADSSGLFGNIFLDQRPYKAVLTDSDGNQLWTADPVWIPLPNVISVETIESLREYNVVDTLIGSVIYVNGYYEPYDGGGGFFEVTDFDPGPDNGGTIIWSDTSGIYFIRSYSGTSLYAVWFGAGLGQTDDTSAVQSAIGLIEDSTAAISYGGGEVVFSSGLYKFLGTLTITTSFVTLRGAGTQSTYLQFANGSSDCIQIGSDLNATRDQVIRDLAIIGSGKTAGIGVKYFNVYNTLMDRVYIQGINISVDVGPQTNTITITNSIFLPDNGTDPIGINWHAAADGTSRSDVLALYNILISGSWTDATCILVDGACYTLDGTSVRGIHAKYGLRIRNSAGSTQYYPNFCNLLGMELEGFKQVALVIEAGGDFRFTNCDINNLTGEPDQGSADSFAVLINPDLGASVTRGVMFTQCRIGASRREAIACNAIDCHFISTVCFSSSAEGAGFYPVMRLGANSQQTMILGFTAEEYGGLGRGYCGIIVDAGAINYQIIGIDPRFTTTEVAVVDNANDVNPFTMVLAPNEIALPGLRLTTTYADDAAAAIGGIALGRVYRNGSVVQLRIA